LKLRGGFIKVESCMKKLLERIKFSTFVACLLDLDI
jgi:hypothetical protein